MLCKKIVEHNVEFPKITQNWNFDNVTKCCTNNCPAFPQNYAKLGFRQCCKMLCKKIVENNAEFLKITQNWNFDNGVASTCASIWRQYTFDVMKIARQFPNLSTFSLDLELPCDLHAFFHSSRNAPCELRRFDFICYMLLLLHMHMHMLLLLHML
jgi:hypothetical protein